MQKFFGSFVCALLALVLTACGGGSCNCVCNDGASDGGYDDDYDYDLPMPPTSGACQCNDGIDNDGDGDADYPADRGCSSATDNSETIQSIEVEFMSGTTSQMELAMAPGEGDVVEFTVTYAVTAVGGDVYVDATCTGGGLALLPEDGNVFEIGGDVLVWSELSVDGDSIGESFLVEEGTAVEFKLTVIAEARGNGFVQLVLEGIGWSASPGEGDQMFALPERAFATMPVFMSYL